MLKKKIIFGSVVLLLAALFALTGCSQATDGGTTYLVAENHLYGEVDAAAVARAVDSALRTGRAVVLTDQLIIKGSGTPAGALSLPSVASFGSLAVQVEGRVTVTGNLILNGVGADLSFVSEDSLINVEQGAAFIYDGTQEQIYTINDGVNPPGRKVKLLSGPREPTQGEETAIAVRKYKIGEDVATYVTDIYVLDEFTVDTTSVTPGTGVGNPNVIVLGNLNLTESNSGVFNGIGGSFLFAQSAKLITTTVASSVTLGLPAAGAALPAIKADKPIVITTPDASNTIADLIIAKVEAGSATLTIKTGTISNTLVLSDVAAGAKVAVDVPTLRGDTTIAANAGLIDISSETLLDANVAIASNAATGVINITEETGGALIGDITITTNAGSITIADTDDTAGDIASAVSVETNTGAITLSALSITGGVEVTKTNTKDLIFATGTIGTDAVNVARNENGANIIFSKDLEIGDNLLIVPANYGTISFQGKLGETTPPVLGTLPASPIAGIGDVVFGGAAWLADGSVIDCNVVINGGLTLADGMTFGGNVTLAYEQDITAQAPTPKSIILKAGKVIQVGIASPIPVLAAGNNRDVAITPGTNAVLSATASDPEEEDDLNNQTLHVKGIQAIKSFDTNLIVKGGGILSVDDYAGLAVTGTSTLTLEQDAILAFPGSSPNPAYIMLGATVTLTGEADNTAADARFIARGGAVTLSASKIISSSAGATLAVMEDLGLGTIGVQTTGDLQLEGVNLDLSLNGSVNILNGGKLTLVGSIGKAPGRLTLSDDVSAAPVTYNFNAQPFTTGATIKGKAVVRADGTYGDTDISIQDLAADSTNNVVISTTGNVVITADSSAVTLPAN